MHINMNLILQSEQSCMCHGTVCNLKKTNFKNKKVYMKVNFQDMHNSLGIIYNLTTIGESLLSKLILKNEPKS